MLVIKCVEGKFISNDELEDRPIDVDIDVGIDIGIDVGCDGYTL